MSTENFGQLGTVYFGRSTRVAPATRNIIEQDGLPLRTINRCALAGKGTFLN